MKFLKILSVIFVIAMLSSLFVSCAGVKVEYGISGCFEKKEENNGPAVQDPSSGDETQLRYKVTAHLKIVDYKGREVYYTDAEDPFEYDSAYFEPSVVRFVQSYASMNDKKFSCEVSKNGIISSISITKKGQTVEYAAEETVISEYDGSEQKTYWVCYINDEMVSSMSDTIVKDGDVVALYLVYPDWDKEPIVPEEPSESTAPEA